MEPTQEQVVVSYIIPATILMLEQRKGKQSHPNGGYLPVNNWWIKFDNSHESINLGEERPGFNIGDRVKITITKEPVDALPSQPPLK